LFLLQAQTPTDFSWLSQMGEVALAILGIIAISVIFIKRGLPKYWEYKKELAKINAMREENSLSQLKKIEDLLLQDVQDRKIRQAETDKKFNEIDSGLYELRSNLNETNGILLKVSEDTQYSIFIEEKASIDERLKAFRILIAFERNGDIKKDGYRMVLRHKDIWKIVNKLPLPVKIKNQKYYDDIMAELNRYVFDQP
jgi:hypothetical protein